MEARIARLETAVAYIQRDIHELKEVIRAIRQTMSTDFRILFGTIISVTLGLAGLMAKGFGWL
jgi:hypothetical protein